MVFENFLISQLGTPPERVAKQHFHGLQEQGSHSCTPGAVEFMPCNYNRSRTLCQSPDLSFNQELQNEEAPTILLKK